MRIGATSRACVTITLPINGEPWTPPAASIGRRKGKLTAYVSADPALKAYEAAVADEARAALPDDWEPFDGPILLEFFFWRRLSSYLGSNGRRVTKNQVDATNLQKATEDGLQKVLFTNDRNVVEVHSYIMEQEINTRAGLMVRMHTDFSLPEVEIDWDALDMDEVRRPTAMVRDFDVEEVF